MHISIANLFWHGNVCLCHHVRVIQINIYLAWAIHPLVSNSPPYDPDLRRFKLVADNRFVSNSQLFCRFVKSKMMFNSDVQTFTSYFAVGSLTTVVYDWGDWLRLCLSKELLMTLSYSPALTFGQEVGRCYYQRNHIWSIMATQVELIWVRELRPSTMNQTINSGQRQRWSPMTVLYLSVRPLIHMHGWNVVWHQSILGALRWNTTRCVCLQD